MADATFNSDMVNMSNKKRSGPSDDQFAAAKKHQPMTKPHDEDPAAALGKARHEFGEHGGVNMSIEASATFTVMESETMRRMFTGEHGPDRDFFIYSRHFNPTVLNLGRLIAAVEGTDAAYCTASGMYTMTAVKTSDSSSFHQPFLSEPQFGHRNTSSLYLLTSPTATVATVYLNHGGAASSSNQKQAPLLV